MKKFLRHILPGLCLVGSVAGQSPKEIRFETTAKSAVRLDGRSNINTFGCEAVKILGYGSFFTDSALSRSIRGAANLTVAVEDLDCKNSGMNEDLKKTLQADRYPSIHYSLDSVTQISAGPVSDEFFAQVHGQLTVSGVTRNSIIRFTIRRLGPDQFLVMGSQTIRLTDFNIDPPKVFLGLIRVKDEIVIHFDIIAKQITEDADF